MGLFWPKMLFVASEWRDRQQQLAEWTDALEGALWVRRWDQVSRAECQQFPFGSPLSISFKNISFSRPLNSNKQNGVNFQWERSFASAPRRVVPFPGFFCTAAHIDVSAFVISPRVSPYGKDLFEINYNPFVPLNISPHFSLLILRQKWRQRFIGRVVRES